MFTTIILVSTIMIKVAHYKRFTVEMAIISMLTIVTSIFALGLIVFGLNMVKHYSRNLSTNERLRKRWNGYPKNMANAKLYFRDSSAFAKM